MELKHKTNKKISSGKFYPLGATAHDNGVNFALFSQDAKEVYLLLFDSSEGEPTDCIRIENRTRFIWHVFVPGIGEGQLYAYKVRGEFNPGGASALTRTGSCLIPARGRLPANARTVTTCSSPMNPDRPGRT